ncbi:MAG: AmmeMemoRadiSam system protein B [Candidatus Hydrogenedentes bacterium]|nr:AmmeMemoRadiSam system protein B [Candidatus Hydrogenedentota bacterium]
MCPTNDATIRHPAVSGMFYPQDPSDLRADVRKMLAAAGQVSVPGDLIAVIVPHAGIMYSGTVAAHAYRLLKPDSVARVVLVGASHRHPVHTVSVYPRGSWLIPGSEFPVDHEFIDAFTAKLSFDIEGPQAHDREHCLEVQLPFLAETVGPVPISPMLLGRARPVICEELGHAIAKTIHDDRPALLVASSDLSHFYDQQRAKKLDTVGIKAIMSLSAQKLYERSRAGETELCGRPAVMTVMCAAKELGANSATMLSYATSGDVTGDWNEVVGYTAIALTRRH